MIKESKGRLTISLDKKQLKWLEKASKRFGMSQSAIIEMALENSEEELRMLDGLGLRPERLSKVMKAIKSVGAALPELEKAGLA